MSHESPLIQSLRTAVAAAPTDVPLRLHLAELLLGEGLSDAAVSEAAVALQHAPGDAGARALMVRAMGMPAPEAPEAPAAPAPTGFDWRAAEDQVKDAVPPRFVTPEAPVPVAGQGDSDDAAVWEVDTPGSVTLADVGGMQEIKDRLEAAFLAPMRNPELGRLYGKSLRGGLLMYGPPGCGKTFIARAVAGELGASFMSVSINDVLDMWMGNSERNMHEVFETARRQAPCVLFLDEVDALGAKRSRMHHGGMRNTVNQLLTELDGVDGANEGVFVLAATNVPWDVDIALRRPGRLDRTLLVLPPDAPAREAILRYHLRDRPIESVDLGKLVKVTEDLSGADLAHLCESASERALLDSTRTGTVRMINMKDLLAAAKEVRPSTDPWFASARNVAMFANEGGMYDELLAYLKRKRKL
ncbi:ATP-binding protein [Streptomyces sp. JH14]|uniref:ATP-binding protein n=1 Tax=Streptomyces sp. JH14 TaxID=2793630 RepID=UPI0023F7E4F6|nr:ATP-binding protein [Streptomyces sp. JH14]MDF6044069.1 ATP-binding protein [Streptomyces sp. JH14]